MKVEVKSEIVDHSSSADKGLNHNIMLIIISVINIVVIMEKDSR